MPETSKLTARQICEAIDSNDRDILASISHADLLKQLGAIRWYSVHQGAKRVCDKARVIFKTQEERAAACRYHHLARSVIQVNGISTSPVPAEGRMIYDSSYGDDEFGLWTAGGES